jgi:cholesterol transport system auxiliary component
VKCASPCARVLIAWLLLACSGCSGFLHSTAKAEQTYYLRSTAAAATGVTALPVSLRVAAVADPGLDTSHIVLVQADHRMSSYTGSRWPSTSAAMMEALAVQALRASGDWLAVQDSGSPFPADFLLQVTVRGFEADYSSGAAAPQVHVVLDGVLGRHDAGEVLATFESTGTATASENRMAAVVGAFEQATNAALAQLTQQTRAAVRASQDAAPQKGVNPVPSSSR